MHRSSLTVTYGTLTPSGAPFQGTSVDQQAHGEGSVAPSHNRVLPQESSADWLVRLPGLGSSRFARRYSGNPLFSSGY